MSIYIKGTVNILKAQVPKLRTCAFVIYLYYYFKLAVIKMTMNQNR